MRVLASCVCSKYNKSRGEMLGFEVQFIIAFLLLLDRQEKKWIFRERCNYYQNSECPV